MTKDEMIEDSYWLEALEQLEQIGEKPAKPVMCRLGGCEKKPNICCISCGDFEECDLIDKCPTEWLYGCRWIKSNDEKAPLETDFKALYELFKIEGLLDKHELDTIHYTVKPKLTIERSSTTEPVRVMCFYESCSYGERICCASCSRYEICKDMDRKCNQQWWKDCLFAKAYDENDQVIEREAESDITLETDIGQPIIPEKPVNGFLAYLTDLFTAGGMLLDKILGDVIELAFTNRERRKTYMVDAKQFRTDMETIKEKVNTILAWLDKRERKT